MASYQRPHASSGEQLPKVRHVPGPIEGCKNSGPPKEQGQGSPNPEKLPPSQLVTGIRQDPGRGHM